MIYNNSTVYFYEISSFLYFLKQEVYKLFRKINRNDIILGKVQQGDLQVEISGYGVLRSDKQKLLTALTAATVEEVVLKPGAKVTSDSILLKLSNPELMQKLEHSYMAIAKEKANLRRVKLNNSRILLTESAQLSELNAFYKKAKLKRDAEEGLVKQKIISRLTYQTSVLEQEQLSESVEIQLERMAQLKLVNKEAINIQQGEIFQVEALHQAIQHRVDMLTVRAGIDGVLQRLPVKLGQSLVPGQELALIGSVDDLLALIKISQTQAENVQVGHNATVKIRRDHITGIVSRITPEVQEGTIEVEIKFTQKLPDAARLELSVDAIIYTAKLDNVFYLERPVNIRSHASKPIYKFDKENKLAQLTTLSFGEAAGRYIEIKKGAKLNDTFILTDMSSFKGNAKINITN
ncbi:MAG: efflux RND transporter periplasmic adaptor subunit [Gammaproteobacteria bacterium]|nr:efflux RND transporter periplasmic adaptor subunit [Gammaproteobacteria bacterium]